MKVGTQLTVMMLVYLAPIGIACTVVTGHSAVRIFSRDLKSEASVAQRALNASLTPDVEQGKRDEVRYTVSAIGHGDLAVALLDESGRLRFALGVFLLQSQHSTGFRRGSSQAAQPNSYAGPMETRGSIGLSH